MHIEVKIIKNSFKDSVYLMRLSSLLREMPAVMGAELIMGTEYNKRFLKQGGLLTAEIEENAEANDLVIVVRAQEEKEAKEALQRAEYEMNKEVENSTLADDWSSLTFETALKKLPGANLALLSIPGQYVEREARKILDAGMHLFIFSDNVSLESEISLKRYGAEKGLLVMGPDCGTAIINGIPLAFANEVRRGSIGVVAAAGTGLQEVSSLIHNLGEGISQGLGTGGRDVKDDVGGITMLLGLKALMDDPQTEVIVVVSKPPGAAVTEKVLSLASRSSKPVVINFIGGSASAIAEKGLEPASTLRDAAQKAVDLVRTGRTKPLAVPAAMAICDLERKKLSESQKYLRGLFSGGTLAYETIAILQEALGGIYSNTPLKKEYLLQDSYKSVCHTIIDLGEDEFTQGRPHPMIDPSLRNSFIVKEAGDPETAVIMLDIVLGYGAHQDPAGAALEAIKAGKKAAEDQGRQLIFVASVCGTELDFQNRLNQVSMLESEGVLVFPSNADAGMFVKELLS